MQLNYFGVPFPVKHPKGSCRVCGCTDEKACPGGCSWALPDICSACVQHVWAIIDPPKRAYATVVEVVRSETNPNVLVLALHNATGDWRRAMINRRLKCMGTEA